MRVELEWIDACKNCPRRCGVLRWYEDGKGSDGSDPFQLAVLVHQRDAVTLEFRGLWQKGMTQEMYRQASYYLAELGYQWVEWSRDAQGKRKRRHRIVSL